MECFEQCVERSRFFVQLIRLYGSSQEDLCHVIGLKLALQQQTHTNEGELISETSSLGGLLKRPFYRVLALLIKEQLVETSVLYTYVSD